jgi:hypothetical protein
VLGVRIGDVSCTTGASCVGSCAFVERHSRNCLAPCSGVPCCSVFVSVCAWRLGNTLGLWALKLCVPNTLQGAVCSIATPPDILPHVVFHPLHRSDCTCLVPQRVPHAAKAPCLPACSVMLNCVVTSLCAVFVVLHISGGSLGDWHSLQDSCLPGRVPP